MTSRFQLESELEQASSTRNHRRAAMAKVIAAEVRVASGQDDTVTLLFPAQRKERGLPRRVCCKPGTERAVVPERPRPICSTLTSLE